MVDRSSFHTSYAVKKRALVASPLIGGTTQSSP
jgi:hypothetical protein